MSVNILDLARPEPAEAEDEHVHAVERMTSLDHAIMAFFISLGIICWLGIGTVIATLLHLNGAAAIAVMVAWPIGLGLVAFLVIEAVARLQP